LLSKPSDVLMPVLRGQPGSTIDDEACVLDPSDTIW
jgi:hypothetical protein